MLVLCRKLHESILIQDNIRITITSISGGQVRLGIEAPREIPVVREELIGTDRALPEHAPKRQTVCVN